jgi:hypothetical protein
MRSERKVVPCNQTAQRVLFVVTNSVVAQLTRTNSSSCVESARKLTAVASMPNIDGTRCLTVTHAYMTYMIAWHLCKLLWM